MDDLPQFPFPNAPQWSLLVGTAGRFLVGLAVAAMLASALGWLLSPKYPKLKRLGGWGFTIGCLSLFGTFLSLAVLFGTNRLEFEYVWGHGDGSNTLPYRIAGIWSGQEGSFLLWACSAAIFGLLAVRGTGEYRRWFTVVYAVFLGSIAAILAYETPFNLNMMNGVPVVPEVGIGLAPSLQNYWVTIHPPTIFLGFGSLTVLAAYAFAALATGKLQDWIVFVRPWSIVSMTLVGVGLCMGGFWAYETLGWGGFWMWDPVENVSFVSWVLTIAFVHGTMVQIARKRWTISNLLMGGLPFLLFVYGTFLTRSGALSETSVHSFAEMDRFAHKLLLGFMVCATIGFAGLWIWRAIQFSRSGLQPDPTPRGISRESFFKAGSILLLALGIATAIGMSVPLFMAIAGKKPSVVEENMYHRILVWIFIPLMLVMAAAPLIGWRGMGTREFLKRIYGVLCVTLILVGGSMAAVATSSWLRGIDEGNEVRGYWGLDIPIVPWVLFLVALCTAVMVASIWRVVELFRRSKISAAAFLSHISVAVLMTGLIVSRGFERRDELLVQDGVHAMGLGYLVTYKGRTGDVFDRNNKLLFEMRSQSDTFTAKPGMYYIRGNDGALQTMVWPHIERYPLHDIYFVVQPPVTELSDEVTLLPGQTAKMDRLTVKFVKNTRKGEPGMQGTQFGALLEVQDGPHTFKANPSLELSPDGTKEHAAPVARDFMLRMTRMDAGTGAVTLKLGLAKAIFPIELFYKPLTGLVWGGTALFALSGFVAAWYRRRPVSDRWMKEVDETTEEPAAPGDASEPMRTGT